MIIILLLLKPFGYLFTHVNVYHCTALYLFTLQYD